MLKNSLLTTITVAVTVGCAHRQSVDYCNAASLNKVVAKLASQRTSSAEGAIVFAARTVEDPHTALVGALIVLRADSAIGLKPDSIRTDATGKGRFESLPAGRYRFVARLIGRHPVVDSPVTVRTGATDTVQLLLAPYPICENWPVVLPRSRP